MTEASLKRYYQKNKEILDAKYKIWHTSENGRKSRNNYNKKRREYLKDLYHSGK